MARFEMNTSVPRHLLVTVQGGPLSGRSTGDSIYHLFDNISNLQYCFDIAPLHTRENVILKDPMEGRIACFLEELPPATILPPFGVDSWHVFRCVEAPSGEGGILAVTHATRALLITALGPRARVRGRRRGRSPTPPPLVPPTLCPLRFWKKFVKRGRTIKRRSITISQSDYKYIGM